jgi:hypothetical protein
MTTINSNATNFLLLSSGITVMGESRARVIRDYLTDDRPDLMAETGTVIFREILADASDDGCDAFEIPGGQVAHPDEILEDRDLFAACKSWVSSIRQELVKLTADDSDDGDETTDQTPSWKSSMLKAIRLAVADGETAASLKTLVADEVRTLKAAARKAS